MRSTRSPFGRKPARLAGRGFTLVEAMIALVIFGFFLMAITWHQMNSAHSVAHARHVTDATSLAQSRLEQLVRQPVANLASGAHPNNPVSETGAAGGIYTQSWAVRADPRVAGVREVVVSVAWADKDGDHVVRVQGLVGP